MADDDLFPPMIYGNRKTRVYPVMEFELRALKHAPFWTRAAILKRIFSSVEFPKEGDDSSRNGVETSAATLHGALTNEGGE